MKVRFSLRAKRRVKLVATWWRTNRLAAPNLFTEELDHGIETLARHPSIGPVYETVRGEVLRRLLLPKTQQHIYYSVDEEAGVVVIHTVWGARRGRSPKL